MKISNRGLDLLKHFEGCELAAYKCPAGVWTIGYGHTGPEVGPGHRITKADAEDLLRADLAKFEGAVSRLVQVPLTQYEFDALVCFVYNVGVGAFEKSTMLALLNKSDYPGAAIQFLRWNKANGNALPGLTRRRAAERELFELDE